MVSVPVNWPVSAAPAVRQHVPGVPNFRIYHPGVLSVSGRAHNCGALKALGIATYLTWETEEEAPHLQSRCEAAGLRFIRIAVPDGHVPKPEQFDEWLAYAADPSLYPLHDACKGGEERSNMAAMATRLAYDGWEWEKTVLEAQRFITWHFGTPPEVAIWWKGGPLEPEQAAFLRDWAKRNGLGGVE